MLSPALHDLSVRPRRPRQPFWTALSGTPACRLIPLQDPTHTRTTRRTTMVTLAIAAAIVMLVTVHPLLYAGIAASLFSSPTRSWLDLQERMRTRTGGKLLE